MSSSDGSPPDAERAVDAIARAHLARGEREDAAWAFLIGAGLALARGDRARATAGHARAVRAAAGIALARPSLIPHLLLLESEIAAESGDLTTSARLSIRALAGFRAAGDDGGVLAAWTARAVRALRAGNTAAADDILAELLPALDARGDRDRGVWLRVRLAAALARTARRSAAGVLLARANELSAPRTPMRLAVTAEAMRLMLDEGRIADALGLGLAELEGAPIAPALDAEVALLCAAALAARGDRQESEAMAARAAGIEGPGVAEARSRLEAARSAGSAGDARGESPDQGRTT